MRRGRGRQTKGMETERQASQLAPKKVVWCGGKELNSSQDAPELSQRTSAECQDSSLEDMII